MEDKEILDILRKYIKVCEDKMCLRSPNTKRIQMSIYNRSDYNDFNKVFEWLQETKDNNEG